MKNKVLNQGTIVLGKNYMKTFCMTIFILVITSCSPPITMSPTITATLQPKFTETSSPTQELTSTSISTTTPTITPSPTEENYIPWDYSWSEGFEKFGYQFGVADRMTEGSPFEWETGLMVINDFIFEEYDITYKGKYLVGNIDFGGENYPLRLLIDEGISYYATGSSGHTMNTEVIKKFMKAGKRYQFYSFIFKKDSKELMHKPESINEEWKEVRGIVEDLFVNGGENEKFVLMLNYVQLNR